MKIPSKFYLAAGNNDEDLINEILNSQLEKIVLSFKDLKISETMPMIKNCDLYLGNDTGWLHIAAALELNVWHYLWIALFKLTVNILKILMSLCLKVKQKKLQLTILWDAEKISFEKVLNNH